MGGRAWLIGAAALDFIAAALHLAIIAGGAEWYRFFGAGEDFATAAARGEWFPDLVTLGIAMVLTTWGLYCLRLAGKLPYPLPWPRAALVAITAIYGVRALAPVIAVVAAPTAVDGFLVWSSLICAVYALTHAMGLRAAPSPD